MPKPIGESCAKPQPVIEFDVLGFAPAPQGSKKAVGRDGKGRAILVESCKNVKPWRQCVALAFLERYGRERKPMIEGPVIMEVTFCFIKPKSNKCKYPSVKPDLSKVVRSTEDALSKLAYEDDSRIVAEMTRKLWAGTEGALSGPGARIRIRGAL